MPKTVLINGSITLELVRVTTGRTYYKLLGKNGDVLLEFDIERNGRRIDYLKLDRFWGYAPRPFF